MTKQTSETETTGQEDRAARLRASLAEDRRHLHELLRNRARAKASYRAVAAHRRRRGGSAR